VHIRKIDNPQAEEPEIAAELEKTALDRGWTNRISLIHDLDPDLQSSANYGHDLLALKSSRSTVSRFHVQSRNKRTDGQTNGGNLPR